MLTPHVTPINCLHPQGRASGQLQIMAFMVCDDCGQLLRFLPKTNVDYLPLTALIAQATEGPLL